MYLIIVGAGNIGMPLIQLATADANEVVVVEQDPDVADAAARAFDCLMLNRDATVAETLQEAGADEADAIVSTTDRDATNVMVMLLADQLGIPTRVSVVHDEEHMGLFERIGVNTMEHPQQLIADHLYRAVKQPSVEDVLHLAGEAEIFEITVAEDAPLAGLSLAAADEQGLLGDDGLLVVAIERGNDVLTPRGDTTVLAGDLVTVFSRTGFAPDVLARFDPQGATT
ncbi:potassium channel family protein [Haloglomus salinum]|jgi:trk system potassium uptake protein TrkA|uniref:potassium channel family protein n=1 Tax=Haloglomus salinum TaxID=2962673 RepID=UPI0020C94E1E|nr:TrkA family potassium uptake protein [Haloglomus salinum]